MLKIYFDGQKQEFDDDDLEYMYIDEGSEGYVYRCGKDAFKIYKTSCDWRRLNEDECIKLSSISTKRVLLPEKPIYGEDGKMFVGYSTSFIYKVPQIEILKMKIPDFVNELDIIKDDLRTLADNGVMINDWHSSNILYNGKLFIGDPGQYVFKENITGAKIFRENIYTLNSFVKDSIFIMAHLSANQLLTMKDVFYDYEYIGDQIRDSMKKKETVRQFVKRIVR